jgi:hypothetical protein
VRKFLQNNGQLAAKQPPNNGKFTTNPRLDNGKFMTSNPTAEKCNGSTHDENDRGGQGAIAFLVLCLKCVFIFNCRCLGTRVG